VIGTILGGFTFQIAYRWALRAYERRVAPRRWGNPVAVRLDSYELNGTPDHALVVNRSDAGLGLLVDRICEPGTLLRVRAEEAPAHIPWVQIEVRHYRAAGRNWVMGCRFTEPVNWDVRAWFG
jgi:hypothetical protein